MSRLTPETKLENPCTRFLDWSGSDGVFTFFDKQKEAAEKGTGKTVVAIPFQFIVLDTLVTIAGYSDADESRFWSNEIPKKQMKTAVLKVRNKNGAVIEGTYENIKGKHSGMKYAESIYIAYKDGAEFKLGNIKAVGSFLSAWINYVAGEKDDNNKVISLPHDPFKGAISVASVLEKKKGATKYKVPVFVPSETKPETEAKALEVARVLESYLSEYLKQSNIVSSPTPSAEEVEATFDAMPSAREVAMAKKSTNLIAPPMDELNDLPF